MKSGFAYGNELPLCYLNEDGSVNREQSMKLIDEAIRFVASDAIENIPASERVRVVNEIKGAAASYGMLSEPT